MCLLELRVHSFKLNRKNKQITGHLLITSLKSTTRTVLRILDTSGGVSNGNHARDRTIGNSDAIYVN